MKARSFGFLVVSVSLLVSLGACSSSDSSGSGGKGGSGGGSTGGSGGTGAGGTGGTSTGGTGTGGTGTGGTGTGGSNTGGSAGQGTGGGNTGGSAGAGTGGAGGAPSCAVASTACKTCRTTHCDAQDAACQTDTACNGAGQTVGACVCSAQTAKDNTALQQCLTTFGAIDATAKAIADCMVQSCKTPCGL